MNPILGVSLVFSFSVFFPEKNCDMMDRTNPAGQEASLLKEFTIGKNDAGQRLDRWLATYAWPLGMYSNYTSTTSFLKPPIGKMPFCLCSNPSWTLCMRTRT